MKHLYIIGYLVIILLIPTIGKSQEDGKEKQAKYKSLNKRYSSFERSVADLLQEARKVMKDDPQLALDKVEEALALSVTQKNVFNQAQCYLLLGNINYQIKEWGLAIENFQKAYQLLKVDHIDTPEYLETLDGIGNALVGIGDYAAALRYFQFKLKVAKTIDDRALTYVEIAEAQYYLKNYAEAQATINQAEESLARRSNSNFLLSRIQALKAKIYAQNNDLDAAEDYYQQSQMQEIEEDTLFAAKNDILKSTKEEIINVYRGQNRTDDEIEFRNMNIASNTLKGKALEISKDKREIGKVLIDRGETYEAIRQLEEAAQLADSLGDAEEQANTYKSLAEAYEQAGRNSDALQAYHNFGEAMDKVDEKTRQKQLLKFELIKKQKDIEAMTKDLALDESEYELGITTTELQENQVKSQRFAIYGLSGLLLLAVGSSVIIYRNARKSKVMSQLLALKSLRSQMNPHFIFNALNSVNQFVAKSDERAANKFLTEFSKLMRLVLDSSQKDFITLQEEKEIIALYLKLEHYRFRDKFEYTFDVDPQLSLDTIEVPPMLIQPYIENAIWHGLRYKEDIGKLEVKIEKQDAQLVIRIKDDGIGRKRSRELKTSNQKKHNSTGLKNTLERMDIVNKVYHKNYSIVVEDLKEDGTGTQVEIKLPLEA